MPKLLKAVIYCLKPRHPTLPLFPRCRWQVDESGNPTGVCVPFFESFMRRYEDSSVLEFNGQGTICCAEDYCSGLGFGPPFDMIERTREERFMSRRFGRPAPYFIGHRNPSVRLRPVVILHNPQALRSWIVQPPRRRGCESFRLGRKEEQTLSDNNNLGRMPGDDRRW